MVEFPDRVRSLLHAQGRVELIWAEPDPDRIQFLESQEIASNLHVLPKLGIVAGEVRSSTFQRLLDSGVVPLGLNEVIRVSPVEHVIASAGPAGGNWGVDFLGLPEVWTNTKGDGVTVAILDSGVDGSHPAFEGRVMETSYLIDYAGRVQQKAGVARDSGYHGTHVASIVAANQVRLPSEDVVPLGMAPAARICNIQVLERDAGTVFQVIAGIEAIIDLGIDIDVVNLSAEVGGQNAAFVPAVRALVEKGVIVVVAAGNTGQGVTASPGNYPYELVFSVGAHAEDGSVWPSSNGAITVWDDAVLHANVPVPTISAPGVKILGAAPGGGLKMLSGTSMAAPHVAGICALLKSSNKKLQHIDALELLKGKARDSGVAGWDNRFGEGLLSIEGLLAG